MLTLILAAAAAAAQPGNAHSQMVAQASQPSEHSQMGMMQMGQPGEHKAMDCCKDGCKDMAGKHDGDAAGHAEHKDR
jgi:hypothetical protein